MLTEEEFAEDSRSAARSLLANVYLNALDRAWDERHRRLGQLTRYADDLVICCWKPGHARRARVALASELAALGLRLSEQKTRVVVLEVGGEGLNFLGFHFRRVRSRSIGRPYIACWPSQRAMAAARQRIKQAAFATARSSSNSTRNRSSAPTARTFTIRVTS